MLNPHPMKDNSRILKITNVLVTDLNPAPYNPRKWDKKAVEDLTESIKSFGIVDPILVNSAPNRKNIVIGGHFRLKIAKDLGCTEIPVVYINIPEEEREVELNLRLNRDQGAWDYDLLKNFDISLLLDIGFDDSDLHHIWDEVLETEDDHFDEQEEIKKITPFVKEGEMYELGNHRLICGDSTKLEVVQRLAGKTSIELVCADPPFNISLNYNNGIGTKGKYGGTKVQDNKSRVDYKSFLKKTIENALSIAQKDCHFAYWCDERYIGLIQELYEEVGIKNERVCIWLKNNQMATPQVAFNKVYEPCVYGITGEPFLSQYHTNFNEILNKEVSTGNRLHGEVMDLFNIWLESRLPSSEYLHPTSKPPTLYEKIIRRCTKPGDTILELFGGSGATLIAAEQMKRSCFMVELDPLFCSLIITRYEKLTGKKAKLLN